MKLWGCKEDYAICDECSVYFEPEDIPLAVIDPCLIHLCRTCRKPYIERAERKRVVMDWIERHCEEYEEAAKKEAADRKAAMASAMRASLAASGSSPLNALSGARYQEPGNHLSGRYQQE